MTTEEIHSGLLELDINLRGQVVGDIKTTCPKCSHERKNKRDKSLSVNIDKGVYNCHHCGWSGTVVKLQKEVIYEIPEINNTELKDDSLRYFKKRGINQATIKRWKITESEDEGGRWINFNYFQDERLVNIKYRGKDKKFKLSKGAKLIFYGLDFIKDNDYCVITEGEFDALSFYESNVLSICSVPNGATKGGNLKYLDNCIDYFENKTKVVLATDSDEPGTELKKELVRRLGAERCYQVNFKDCKDANEYLLKYGDYELKKAYENAKQIPLPGISVLTDFEKDLDYIYQYGYPKGAETGWHNFDKHLKFMGGQFTTMTGIPGSGKSEFLDNIAYNLNRFHHWKFGVFSPENSPLQYHASKLCEKYVGKRFRSMEVQEYAHSKVWVHENFYWVNFENEDLSLTGILNKFKELVLRHGIKAGIIDPWNQLENKVPYGMTETQFVSHCLYEIMNFCLKYDFHLFLVAHPVKLKKDEDGKFAAPSLYDISGSSHFFNKTYNGFTTHRDYGTNHDNYLDYVDVYIQKVKFKWCGQVGKVRFRLNKETTRYEEV